MASRTDVSSHIVNEEIFLERQANSVILDQLRLVTVAAFFALHIITGHIANNEIFRGKETLFTAYLFVSIAAFFLPFNHSKLGFFREHSLALFDIPFTIFLLMQWLPVLDATMVGHRIGVLCVAFMMFFIHLSGLFFQNKVVLSTSAAALLAILQIFSITELPLQTRIPGILLLLLSTYATLKISGGVRRLVTSAAHKQIMNDKFSRYFTPDVADAIQSNSQQELQRKADVTVMFTDIRDFTKMSSTMDAANVIQMLNELHEYLVSCIFLTGGTLDKYLGDGVMAYFGAPVESPDHADKAVECALMMRAQIEDYNQKRRARGEQPISVGIGLHSGPAVIGDIGAEIRREFTVIGDTVNIAARTESLTKHHKVDLLLTSETKHRLKKQYNLRSMGLAEVKGSEKPLETVTL